MQIQKTAITLSQSSEKQKKTEMTAYEMEESSSAPSAERRPLKQPAHPNAFKRQKRALVSK